MKNPSGSNVPEGEEKRLCLDFPSFNIYYIY